MTDSTIYLENVIFSYIFWKSLYTLKARRDMEKRIDREFEDYLNGTQRTISIMDQEIERKKR